MTATDVPEVAGVLGPRLPGHAGHARAPGRPRHRGGRTAAAESPPPLSGHRPGRQPRVADDDGAIVGLSQSFSCARVTGSCRSWPRCRIPSAGASGAGCWQRAMGNADARSPGSIPCSAGPRGHGPVRIGRVLPPPGGRRVGRRTTRGRVRGTPGCATAVTGTSTPSTPSTASLRGSARRVDITAMLKEPGVRLLLLEDRGYAVAKDDRIVTLGARDEEAATARCSRRPWPRRARAPSSRSTG